MAERKSGDAAPKQTGKVTGAIYFVIGARAAIAETNCDERGEECRTTGLISIYRAVVKLPGRERVADPAGEAYMVDLARASAETSSASVFGFQGREALQSLLSITR